VATPNDVPDGLTVAFGCLESPRAVRSRRSSGAIGIVLTGSDRWRGKAAIARRDRAPRQFTRPAQLAGGRRRDRDGRLRRIRTFVSRLEWDRPVLHSNVVIDVADRLGRLASSLPFQNSPRESRRFEMLPDKRNDPSVGVVWPAVASSWRARPVIVVARLVAGRAEVVCVRRPPPGGSFGPSGIETSSSRIGREVRTCW
jgi:hypothetical protein